MIHSQGPWKLGDDIRLPTGRTVVSADDVKVADLMERISHLSRDECEANAILIAESTELLRLVNLFVDAARIPRTSALADAVERIANDAETVLARIK